MRVVLSRNWQRQPIQVPIMTRTSTHIRPYSKPTQRLQEIQSERINMKEHSNITSKKPPPAVKIQGSLLVQTRTKQILVGPSHLYMTWKRHRRTGALTWLGDLESPTWSEESGWFLHLQDFIVTSLLTQSQPWHEASAALPYQTSMPSVAAGRASEASLASSTESLHSMHAKKYVLCWMVEARIITIPGSRANSLSSVQDEPH